MSASTPHSWFSSARMARPFATLPLLICLALTGCDKKGGGKGTLSGKVTTGSQPVAGELVFVNAEKKEFSTLIGLEGKYSISDLPTGTYKVYVRGGMAPTATGPGMKAP